MQESRLFKIIYYLLNKGCATAPELADKFEVSVRTIYRDVDALSEAGIPIYCEPGRGGGSRVMEAFVLSKAVLSENEKQEILSALQSLNAVSPRQEQSTLQKLSALFQVPLENWYEVDFSRWGEKTQDNEKFELLKTAIVRHKCVQILYVNSYESESQRIVYPLKLLYKSKSWYLKAYCTKREDFRLFKLNRILQWKLLQEEFTPVPYPEPTAVLPQQLESIMLRFPREMAYRVYDEFDPGQIHKTEKGELIVSAQMPPDAWVTGYLLSFGPQVEVLEPACLREVLAEQAMKIYEKNKT